MEDRESCFIPSRLFGTAGQKCESTDKLKDKKMSVSSKKSVKTYLLEDVLIPQKTYHKTLEDENNKKSRRNKKTIFIR